MKPLSQGQRGPQIARLQHFLIGAGYPCGEVDHQFGPQTRKCVAAYQVDRQLTADGIVGNKTLAAMLADGFALMPSVTPGPRKPDFPPLVSNSARGKVFGTFAYRSAPVAGNPEAITITDGWDDRNIALIQLPQLVTLGLSKTGSVRFHRLAVDQLRGLWTAWERAGLLHHVKSWEGAYVPRYIRGSRSTLSNHAYGSAFDINYTGNELGREPAAAGTRNSVRELVPLAHEWGFYWGGHFSRADGMHFEIARLIP